MKHAWNTDSLNLGHRVQRQAPAPSVYKGIRLECGYRIDLLVIDLVVVEVKYLRVLGALRGKVSVVKWPRRLSSQQPSSDLDVRMHCGHELVHGIELLDVSDPLAKTHAYVLTVQIALVIEDMHLQ